MTVYYRGPDPRRPDIIITHSLIKVRVRHGWQVWIISELDDFGITHTPPPTDRVMVAMGTSVVLLGLLAYRLRGWALFAVAMVFIAGVAIAMAEQRWTRSRQLSQLRASYHGTEIMVIELPHRDMPAACRGLIRALERQNDTQS
ncbi:DUF6232 family protein [Actinoplanes sp. TFC3]|uniref:DUF6232 family protein n=1 Tax=Actinoplanes sp. TFC3 TaxID=1710355 RepID=UPI000AF19202|nr:DUF6232 family protein [Actinoplanes sp. TFC3]